MIKLTIYNFGVAHTDFIRIITKIKEKVEYT